MILDPIAYWLNQVGALGRGTRVEQPDPVERDTRKLAAHRVLRSGRTMWMALGRYLQWHLRRRKRQVIRDFPNARGIIGWMAPPRADQDVEPTHTYRKPWWLI